MSWLEFVISAKRLFHLVYVWKLGREKKLRFPEILIYLCTCYIYCSMKKNPMAIGTYRPVWNRGVCAGLVARGCWPCPRRPPAGGRFGPWGPTAQVCAQTAATAADQRGERVAGQWVLCCANCFWQASCTARSMWRNHTQSARMWCSIAQSDVQDTCHMLVLST
jgi:hypothetical protein